MEYVYNRQNFQTCKASLCYIFGSLSGQFVHFLVFFSSSPKSFQKKKKPSPPFLIMACLTHMVPVIQNCFSFAVVYSSQYPFFFNLSDLIHNWKEHTDLSSVQV